MSGTILTSDSFENAVISCRYAPHPECWEWKSKLIAHDAEQRRHVEELTRERDAAEERADEQRQRAKRAEDERDELRQQVDGVLSIVRHYAQDDGSDPVVGKVRRVMDCYQQALVALSVGAAALAERDALRARLAAMATPTPPAAEASEVEALAQELRSLHSNQVWTQSFTIPSVDSWLEVARYILLREAALRERAERAEAEVARLRDPERERLIGRIVENWVAGGVSVPAIQALAEYECAKEKP